MERSHIVDNYTERQRSITDLFTAVRVFGPIAVAVRLLLYKNDLSHAIGSLTNESHQDELGYSSEVIEAYCSVNRWDPNDPLFRAAAAYKLKRLSNKAKATPQAICTNWASGQEREVIAVPEEA